MSPFYLPTEFALKNWSVSVIWTYCKPKQPVIPSQSVSVIQVQLLKYNSSFESENLYNQLKKKTTKNQPAM